MDERELADRPGDIALSPSELLAKAYRDYQRYHVTLKVPGGTTVEQQRDVIRGGKVVAVLPVDLARGCVVLIRQFRLAAHLANGNGEIVEIVAGRVEAGESAAEAARRECSEEIGVTPTALAELFSYLTSPGLTDEEVTFFVAGVDSSRVPERPVTPEAEQIQTLRVDFDAALAAAAQGRMHYGPLVIALQWLALNRGRLSDLLAR